MRQGSFKEDFPYFQTTLQSKPAFAAAHNNLGIAFGQSGDHERALEHFREAVRLDFDYTEAKDNSTYTLEQAGNSKSNRSGSAPAEPTQDDGRRVSQSRNILRGKR